MDGDEKRIGKAQVQTLLIDRLDAAGLQRPKGLSVQKHEAAKGWLAEHLAYMSADNLMTLAESVLDSARGRVWPTEAVIREFARALQPPPPTVKRLIGSWLASVEGPKAEAGGYLVELYRYLLTSPHPPLPMDQRTIMERASANSRRCEIVRDRIARDVAQQEDRDWLAAYERDRQIARDILDGGRAKRQETAE